MQRLYIHHRRRRPTRARFGHPDGPTPPALVAFFLLGSIVSSSLLPIIFKQLDLRRALCGAISIVTRSRPNGSPSPHDALPAVPPNYDYGYNRLRGTEEGVTAA